MIITSISKRCTNEGNVNANQASYVYDICIDNSYSLSVPEEVYFKHNLYEKPEISDEELEVIKKASSFSMAKTKALTYLSFKARTSKEVENKLIKDGFSANIVAKVIKELIVDGYINDSIYVRRYINDRIKLKPKSKNMLVYELKNKGIDETVILEVLDELKIDNMAIASNLLLKKFNDFNISDIKIKRKIYSFLRYRGFNDSEIRDVLKQIIDNSAEKMP